jgi:hypothetical protein
VRTTVDLDEDILRVAKHLAREKEQSLGHVHSGLIRHGLQPAKITARSGVIPTLPRKPGAKPVTAQTVKELLEADV